MTDTSVDSGSPPVQGRNPLERGRFSHGGWTFVVVASSAVAPDSFQVYAAGNRDDLIMIVSGLTTGNLHATWSKEWRTLSAEWREWLRTNAFRAFHQVNQPRAGSGHWALR